MQHCRTRVWMKNPSKRHFASILLKIHSHSRYYETCHKRLPILPHDPKRLDGYLNAASLHMRNASLHAIYALTTMDWVLSILASSHSPSLSWSVHDDHTLKAYNLITMEALINRDNGHLRVAQDLLHMQVLLLLALNTDRHIFTTPQEGSTSKSQLKEQEYILIFIGSMISAALG